MRAGVVVFPGSNCDHDLFHVLKDEFNFETEFIWHKETALKDFDAIFLPGGFSYGDYLRTGAIARFSPIMAEVKKFAENGGIVVGICNGFQMLCELNLLPGALRRNAGLNYVCKQVDLRVEDTNAIFTSDCRENQVLRMPVAHGDGNYYADEETVARLEKNSQILFRYSTPNGEIEPSSNPNGAIQNIAGIRNEKGNVLGMMPHPERASDPVLGSEDGRWIFSSIVEHLKKQVN